MTNSREIVVRLPGQIIEVFELQDREQWPDVRVVEIKRHGKGFAVFLAGSREGLERFRDACCEFLVYRPDSTYERMVLALVCQKAKHTVIAALKAAKEAEE